MSRPSTSTNTSTVDYTAEPVDITQLRNQAATTTAACCAGTYRKDGLFSSTGHLKQLQVDGVTISRERDRDWKGEVIVDSDGTQGTVTVSIRIAAVNATSRTDKYPCTIYVSNEELAARVAKIPAAIERAWNAKPYQLRITDTQCGERVFNVRFHASMVQSDQHYTIDFVNMDISVDEPDVLGAGSGRSYIMAPDRGKFNLGDWRSATDDNNAADHNVLEPHEFGHMFGLIDEYRDLKYNRGGVKYEFPNGLQETALVNEELMGSMATTTAQPLRYCVTIAYAAIEVLETKGGFHVTDCVIQ